MYVGSFVYSLGERRIHVRESASAGRLISSAEDLESAGFRWHRMCAPDSGSYELAHAAATQLAKLDRLDGTDAIVYSTCIPQNGSVGSQREWEGTRDVKHLMDFPASRLQADFDLDGAVVFGLTQQGCTGMLGSIRLATALLTAEPTWHRVLCLTADRFPDHAKYEQAYNLISDSAAACVVDRAEGAFRYLGAHQITNGGLGLASDDETIGTFFSYAPRVVEEATRRIGLTVADIDWFVVQNANEKAWQILARVLGTELGRLCFASQAEAGHAISADNVINLVELVESGRLRAGDRVALLVAGTGLTYQCVILQAVDR
jgi:3-oxoacyl-[acyl-carrier-protein] synthase-3